MQLDRRTTAPQETCEICGPGVIISNAPELHVSEPGSVTFDCCARTLTTALSSSLPRPDSDAVRYNASAASDSGVTTPFPTASFVTIPRSLTKILTLESGE